MDAGRIRPLFLPPHPRRNRYIPIFTGGPGLRSEPDVRTGSRSPFRAPGSLTLIYPKKFPSQQVSGSGYSTPCVSTVTFFMT